VNVSDIKSADWSFSVSSIGEAVEGVADINQCIGVIIGTQKGSDPFRPDFGSDVWDWIDRPLGIAIPNMKRAIIEAVALWEPRVTITGIEYAYQNTAGENAPVYSGARFNIYWKLKQTQTTGTAEVTLGLYDTIQKAEQTQPPVPLFITLLTESGDVVQTEAGENIVI
jgi:phage baseplate assembly protein W